MSNKQQEYDQMNIFQKLAKIRKQVEVIRKNKSGHGYSYVSDDEILSKVTVWMDKLGLILIPSITPETAEVTPYSYKRTKSTGKGDIYEENVNEILVSADMVYSWINIKNPAERVDVPWVLTGAQRDSSQAFGSGLTYSMRYFLLKFFNISTLDDDPDKWRSKQEEAAKAEDKIIAEQVIKEIDTRVNEYIAKHPDKRDDMKKVIIQYVKSGDYFKICESTLAAKLLAEVIEKFPMEGEK